MSALVWLRNTPNRFLETKPLERKNEVVVLTAKILSVAFYFFGEALACKCSSTLDEKSADRVFVGELTRQYKLEFLSMENEKGEKLEGEEGRKIYGSSKIRNYFEILKVQKGSKEGDYIALETNATNGCGVRLKAGKTYRIYTRNYLTIASGPAKACAFRAKLLRTPSRR